MLLEAHDRLVQIGDRGVVRGALRAVALRFDLIDAPREARDLVDASNLALVALKERGELKLDVINSARFATNFFTLAVSNN